MTTNTRPQPRPCAPGCAITAPHAGRPRVHFADLDNLHGSGDPGVRRINRVRGDYDEIGIFPGDIFYGACNHNPNSRDRANAQKTFHLCTAWPKGTVRPVHGKDAADRALTTRATELIDIGHLSDRFEEAIIASGDHLFALVAHRLRQAGLTVHLVIAHLQGLSKDLERAADGCIWHLHEKRCLRHQTPGARYAIAA